MDPPPTLKSHYQASLVRHKETLREVLDTADAILRSVSLAEFGEHFGHDGTAGADDLNAVWDPLRDQLSFIRDLNPVFQAGLVDPGTT